MIVKCPLCSGNLKIELQPYNDEERTLLDIWNNYLVWCFIGKPEFREEQFWYDNYRHRCDFKPTDKNGNGTAYFSVQIYDSPDGDTWMHVKVPVSNGQLLLEKAEYRYSDYPWYNWEEDSK